MDGHLDTFEGSFRNFLPISVIVFQVEATLLSAGHPVVVGVPGFIIHADMTESRVHILMPRSTALVNLSFEPPSAMNIQEVATPTNHPHGLTLRSFRINSVAHRKMSPATANDEDWTACQMGNYSLVSHDNECPCYVGRARLVLSFNTQGTSSHRTTLKQVNMWRKPSCFVLIFYRFYIGRSDKNLTFFRLSTISFFRRLVCWSRPLVTPPRIPIMVGYQLILQIRGKEAPPSWALTTS